MAKRTPYVWRNVFNNFINSLKPKRTVGDLKGEDHLGNKYYEIPADPSRGKRKPTRWFEPRDKEEFDADKPSEWDSWLRFRRDEPPAADEVLKNLAIQQQKKFNSKILEEKATQERIEMGRAEPQQDVKGKYSYPQYDEYKISDDKK